MTIFTCKMQCIPSFNIVASVSTWQVSIIYRTTGKRPLQLALVLASILTWHVTNKYATISKCPCSLAWCNAVHPLLSFASMLKPFAINSVTLSRCPSLTASKKSLNTSSFAFIPWSNTVAWYFGIWSSLLTCREWLNIHVRASNSTKSSRKYTYFRRSVWVRWSSLAIPFSYSLRFSAPCFY